MMWLVRIALRRPYTFISVAILVLIGGALAIHSLEALASTPVTAGTRRAAAVREPRDRHARHLVRGREPLQHAARR